MRHYTLIGFIILLSLACRTTDLFATNRGEPAIESAAARPTFTPAAKIATPTATRTATRPRATATRQPPAPPTVIPAPTLPPQPPPTPQGPYYRITGNSCATGPNTRIIGTVIENGNKVNGVRVRLSGAAPGPPAIDDSITGKDPTDPRRVDAAIAGQYRLAPAEGQQREGNWFVFIVNDNGDVISGIANVQTSKGPGCNIGTVDFAH